jgi:hypothetical protein
LGRGSAPQPCPVFVATVVKILGIPLSVAWLHCTDRKAIGAPLKSISAVCVGNQETQLKSYAGLVLATMATAAAAQSSVTLYGIVIVAITSVHVGAGTAAPGGGAAVRGLHTVRLDSGVGPASRLGFRGTEDLGDGLSAIFVLENGFKSDTYVVADQMAKVVLNTAR